MVRCCHEDDRAIFGDVEGTSGAYLPEEDASDHAPEDEGGLVGQVGRERERFWMVRHADVGSRPSQTMIKVGGHRRKVAVGLAKTRCWGCSRDRGPYGVGGRRRLHQRYATVDIMYRQTDAKQCDNRKFTMAPFGRTTHCSPYSSCTGRCRAVATAYRPAQQTRLCLSDGETVVCRNEQEKWGRERLNHACSILVLSYPVSNLLLI